MCLIALGMTTLTVQILIRTFEEYVPKIIKHGTHTESELEKNNRNWQWG